MISVSELALVCITAAFVLLVFRTLRSPGKRAPLPASTPVKQGSEITGKHVEKIGSGGEPGQASGTSAVSAESGTLCSDPTMPSMSYHFKHAYSGAQTEGECARPDLLFCGAV